MSSHTPPRPGRGTFHGSVAALRDRATRSGNRRVDLAVGAPVDPTPDVVRSALAAHADAPGYPTTAGSPALREAYLRWLERAHGVTGLDVDQVLPVLGTKEFIGSVLRHLDVPRRMAGIPALAYPTYAVGAGDAGFAGVEVVEGATAVREHRPDVLWLNSPGNPSGRVLAAGDLRDVVTAAGDVGTTVLSDECYLDLGWEATPTSAAGLAGVLAVHSLSKRSNLAGYRAGFVCGPRAVIASLTAIRRDLGLIVPAPIQAAAIAALDDDEHVAVQRERYRRRREVLRAAIEQAGFRVDHSEAGLYLWATCDEPAQATADRFADCGIVVVPGSEYGAAGGRHVRLTFAATDDDVARASEQMGRMAR